MSKIHWQHRLSRPTHCLQCGWKLPVSDKRRRYCAGTDCFEQGRRKYARIWASTKRHSDPAMAEAMRETVRRFRKTEKGKAAQNRDTVRRKILAEARAQARELGVSYLDVLAGWKIKPPAHARQAVR